MSPPTDIDADSSPSCHLLRLPAELRVQIYESLFCHTRTCFIHFDDHRTHVHWHADSPVRAQILRTCRTIYREAQPTLLARAVIDIRCEWIKRSRLEGLEAAKHSTSTFMILTTTPSFRFLSVARNVHITVDNRWLSAQPLPAVKELIDAMRNCGTVKMLRIYVIGGVNKIHSVRAAKAFKDIPHTWTVTWDALQSPSLGDQAIWRSMGSFPPAQQNVS